MKVTYCLSPVVNIRQFPMASRILTSNLLKDNKIDVVFNYSQIESNKIYGKKASDMKNSIEEINKNLSVTYSTWKDWLSYFISIKEYSKKFAESIKTDIVLMSCLYGNVDYPFVAELLNKGLKVVLGGSNFIWMTEDKLKYYLLKLGVKEKYINNFIIVHGFVDLNTDLYKIIKDWKTTTITNNDFSTMWDCNNDYLQNVMNISKNILGDFDPHSDNLRGNFTQSIYLLSNKCWWGKCKFCTYRILPKIDFNKNVSPEKIAENILKTNKKFGSNRVFFANDYFIFNKKNRTILDILKKSNQKITIFSGILLLNNERYLDYVNQYIDYVKVGVEAGTDFALNYIDKGYKVKDIYQTFEKMALMLKRTLHISYNVIIDLPQINEKEVINNYKTALEWKRMLYDFDNIQTGGISFAIFNGLTDDCIDNKFTKRVDMEKSSSGRVYVFEQLRKVYDIDRILYNNLIPFERYDRNNNLMKSDFDIVPFDIFDELVGGNWGWK